MSTVGRAIWITNLIALFGLTAWILCDALFPQIALGVQADFARLAGIGNTTGTPTIQFASRSGLLVGWISLGFTSAVGMFVLLIAGAPVHRRLRSWLVFTAIVAAWLTLWVAWPELAWQGQRLRLRTRLGEFDAIVATLRYDWPTTDDERAGIGAFLAYPQGQPRALLIVKSESGPAISAVERADDGTLRFELSGNESGAWLEWHPVGSTPRRFIGGLEQVYDVDRAAPLGHGWYLVRYR